MSTPAESAPVSAARPIIETKAPRVKKPKKKAPKTNRKVIAIAGDGGFAMLMADFVTAARYELPIVCVVLNNQKLGFIFLSLNVMPAWAHRPAKVAFSARNP